MQGQVGGAGTLHSSIFADFSVRGAIRGDLLHICINMYSVRVRTTLDIPDETYRALKIRAAREGTPVRQIVLRGIQRELAESEERPIRKLQLPLVHSSDPGTLELTNEQIDELTAFS